MPEEDRRILEALGPVLAARHTDDEWAKILNVSVDTIVRWHSGTGFPDDMTFQRILRECEGSESLGALWDVIETCHAEESSGGLGLAMSESSRERIERLVPGGRMWKVLVRLHYLPLRERAAFAADAGALLDDYIARATTTKA